MRLFPGAYGMNRSTRDDEVIAGYNIPAGSWVEVSMWGMHHSAAVWPDPEVFDPRRFDVPPRQFPGGHRYAWMPFGAGPRGCIGMHKEEFVLFPWIRQLEDNCAGRIGCGGTVAMPIQVMIKVAA